MSQSQTLLSTGSVAMAIPIGYLRCMRALGLMLVITLVGACKGDEGSKAKPFQPRAPEAAEAAPARAGDAAAAEVAVPTGPVPAGDVAVSPVPEALAARLSLTRVIDGFRRPIAVEVAPGDGPGELYVVEQVGRIWRVKDGVRAAAPLYDIRRRISRANEQGLLGLVFHPDFERNRKLYVNYTDTDGETNVVEYRLPAGAATLDESSRREILRVRQPFSNHNAGDLEFGPDGKLYVGLGDGGAGGDPLNAGQSDTNVLGKMLRIDVDADKVEREIVIKGLRNPWRYHFDPKTGDLYIGDVGQDLWEEIDVLPAGRIDGANLGWKIMEGMHCFEPENDCDRTGLVLPAVEYDHRTGCSVTGGEVYRGKALSADLDGVYFYADYCEPYIVRSFRWSAATGVRDHWDWTKTLNKGRKVKNIASFGHDADGELYLVSLDGGIYKLTGR